MGGGGSPILLVKQVKCHALACKTYLAQSMTHFCSFALRSHKFSLHFVTVRTYFTIFSVSDTQTRKPDLLSPSRTFLIIVVGFVIRKNVSTIEPFARDILHILDSSRSFSEYICQFSLADRPSLMYSKNDIKAAQTGGGFSVLQLLSLPIVHTTNVLAGDTRRELDLTISDAAVFRTTSLNTISVLVSNSKAK